MFVKKYLKDDWFKFSLINLMRNKIQTEDFIEFAKFISFFYGAEKGIITEDLTLIGKFSILSQLKRLLQNVEENSLNINEAVKNVVVSTTLAIKWDSELIFKNRNFYLDWPKASNVSHYLPKEIFKDIEREHLAALQFKVNINEEEIAEISNTLIFEIHRNGVLTEAKQNYQIYWNDAALKKLLDHSFLTSVKYNFDFLSQYQDKINEDLKNNFQKLLSHPYLELLTFSSTDKSKWTEAYGDFENPTLKSDDLWIDHFLSINLIKLFLLDIFDMLPLDIESEFLFAFTQFVLGDLKRLVADLESSKPVLQILTYCKTSLVNEDTNKSMILGQCLALLYQELNKFITKQLERRVKDNQTKHNNQLN